MKAGELVDVARLSLAHSERPIRCAKTSSLETSGCSCYVAVSLFIFDRYWRCADLFHHRTTVTDSLRDGDFFSSADASTALCFTADPLCFSCDGSIIPPTSTESGNVYSKLRVDINRSS